jgi:hypothetical protein
MIFTKHNAYAIQQESHPDEIYIQKLKCSRHYCSNLMLRYNLRRSSSSSSTSSSNISTSLGSSTSSADSLRNEEYSLLLANAIIDSEDADGECKLGLATESGTDIDKKMEEGDEDEDSDDDDSDDDGDFTDGQISDGSTLSADEDEDFEAVEIDLIE